MIKRFREEAMSASRLNHPNCVSIIDYGQSPDGLALPRDGVRQGPTLTQLLMKENSLPIDRVIDIVMQALAGIEEAHLGGVRSTPTSRPTTSSSTSAAPGWTSSRSSTSGFARLVTGVRDEDRSNQRHAGVHGARW